MSTPREFARGWRGISLIAITYAYFLIFAQFAFLHRLAVLHIADTHLNMVMAAMAIGGILFSLLAARLQTSTPHIDVSTRIRTALVLCTAGAVLTILPLHPASATAVAFLIGAGLGLLTITLVTNLRTWLVHSNPLLQVGMGTGIGYLLCNVPEVFTAPPTMQAIGAAAICTLGIFVAGGVHRSCTVPDRVDDLSFASNLSFPVVLASFTALVWLDSAAFYIIQSTPSLKGGTWLGTEHLWTNGLLHLFAAIASALLLRRRGLSFVFTGAFAALAVACLLLHNPHHAFLASLFYPVGVSLYSVALVAYPALLCTSSSSSDRAQRAAFIYVVAGWIGSALGIGMGQHLGAIPLSFVVAAGLIVLSPAIKHLIVSHTREAAAVAITFALAAIITSAIKHRGHTTPTLTAVERGRQVYISEGCINCHSQYARPHSPDVLMWGPTQTLEELRLQHPPLIGNRRQGPDLSQVGGRRSTLWLRAHFYHPRQVSHNSFMPSYRYLFDNSDRGNDLIAYLNSLKSATYATHIALEQSWQPSANTITHADAQRGATLFDAYCSTCHQSDGTTRRIWHNQFKHLPPTVQDGVWANIPWSADQQLQRLAISRIIKFGAPGTDMPGHEYLSDTDISDIALWLDQKISPAHTITTNHIMTGEHQ